jgi:hypothetical protein
MYVCMIYMYMYVYEWKIYVYMLYLCMNVCVYLCVRMNDGWIYVCYIRCFCVEFVNTGMQISDI